MTNINRQIFDGAKYTLSFSMIQYILYIITQIIFARLLSPSLFGEFAMISIVVMFFFSLSNFCTDKYIIIQKTINNHRLNSLITFDFIYALLSYLIFFVLIKNHFIPNINYEFENSILLFGLVVFYHPFSRNKAIFEKELNFFKARYPSTVATILSSIISIILAMKGFTLLALILWRALQYIFEALILLFLRNFNFRITILNNSKDIRELWKFSTPLIASNIIIYFYWNIDYVIVDSLLGKTQLGYYWLAFQLGLFILRIKDAIVNVVLPVYSENKNQQLINDSFNKISLSVFRLFGLIFITFLFFGEYIFSYTFGEKWLPALNPFLITILLSMIRSFTSFFEPILLIHKKTHFKLILAIFNAVLVPTLVYLLVKSMGIIGAPLGVLISNIFSSIILILLTKKLVKINYLPILYNILFISIIFVLNSIAELNILTKFLILILTIGIYTFNEKHYIK